jgi:hypothetical protein
MNNKIIKCDRRKFLRLMSFSTLSVVGISHNLLNAKGKKGTIQLQPSDKRFVNIHHTDWDLRWDIQFPEVILSRNGVTMMWQKISPHWIKTGENAWAYEWETTPEYIKEQLGHRQKDNSGNIIIHNFIIGLSLRAEIKGFEDRIEMILTITNKSSAKFYDVISDGGCFQARNSDFKNHDEVKRSYILVKGKLKSMGELHRTKDIRTAYHSDITNYQKEWINTAEWFWGRSNISIDYPAILGAVSSDGSKAVLIGYENSASAFQNADSHHCIHSRPSFSDIAPGTSVTRKGYILFGNELTVLAKKLHSILINSIR